MLTYWTGIDYIGFGIGAASYFQGWRYKNISDITVYKELLADTGKTKDAVNGCPEGSLLNDSRPFMPHVFTWHEEIQQLSVQERMEEFMFLGLRLKNGILEQEFYKRFGKKVEEVYFGVINRLIKEGVLLRNDNRIFLSDRGTDVANYVMAQFLLD